MTLGNGSFLLFLPYKECMDQEGKGLSKKEKLYSFSKVVKMRQQNNVVENFCKRRSYGRILVCYEQRNASVST